MSEWLVVLAALMAVPVVLLLGFAGCRFSVGVASGVADLLFYDRTNGLGDFWSVGKNGTITRLGDTHTDWRTSWALIVPGGFGGDNDHSDLLFYDRRGGQGEFWATHGKGKISLIGDTISGWRTSWSLIVPGRFDVDSQFTGLMFYDRNGGLGTFWATHGDGTMSQIGDTHTDWRTSWALIVPGNFGGDDQYTDLLFYDRSTGQGEFWATHGDGTISLIGETHRNWGNSWSLIVPGNFGGDGPHTDLLFYDRTNGRGEFWSPEGDGTMGQIGETHTDWRTSWTLIVPGYFGGPSGLTDLLFYDAAAGLGDFWSTNGHGNIARIGETYTDWRPSWSLITPGGFR